MSTQTESFSPDEHFASTPLLVSANPATSKSIRNAKDTQYNQKNLLLKSIERQISNNSNSTSRNKLKTNSSFLSSSGKNRDESGGESDGKKMLLEAYLRNDINVKPSFSDSTSSSGKNGQEKSLQAKKKKISSSQGNKIEKCEGTTRESGIGTANEDDSIESIPPTRGELMDTNSNYGNENFDYDDENDNDDEDNVSEMLVLTHTSSSNNNNDEFSNNPNEELYININCKKLKSKKSKNDMGGKLLPYQDV